MRIFLKGKSREYQSVNKNQAAEDRTQQENAFVCCRRGKAF
jgi:hypothetical protein